ncbi:hypothetical protein [Arthrobacter methylotrophus]|uniref:hypothetical protein n=1 Tax=Arthrobacter methylotrophus TaxID=121291 RepID=UPI0031E85FCA
MLLARLKSMSLREALHEVLAVVEDSLDRYVVHVLVLQRVHLRALESAHAALRREHEDGDALATAQRMLGGRAGVAGRRAEHVEDAVALAEHVVERLPEVLHGHVLEREGRPLGQADERELRIQFLERHDVLGNETTLAVRVRRELLQVFARDVGREESKHRRRETCVVERAPALEVLVREAR